MTDYKYHNCEISSENSSVGWISENLTTSFDCLCAVKSVLEKHGHTLRVQSFVEGWDEVPVSPYIRDNEGGYYISGEFNDMNYAFFSKEMNCAKSCAKAVLEVIT